MNSRDMAALAAGFAAGLLTEEALSEAVGDDTIVAQIVALAGGSTAAGLAATAVHAASNIPVIEDVFDAADDVIDGVTDLFDWD